jgi:hypothetical protein
MVRVKTSPNSIVVNHPAQKGANMTRAKTFLPAIAAALAFLAATACAPPPRPCLNKETPWVGNMAERDAAVFEMLKHEQARNESETTSAYTSIRAAVLRTKDRDVLLEPLTGDSLPVTLNRVSFRGWTAPISTYDSTPEIYFFSNRRILRNSVYLVKLDRAVLDIKHVVPRSLLFDHQKLPSIDKICLIEIMEVQSNIYKLSSAKPLECGEYALYIPRRIIDPISIPEGNFGWIFFFFLNERPSPRPPRRRYF